MDKLMLRTAESHLDSLDQEIEKFINEIKTVGKELTKINKKNFHADNYFELNKRLQKVGVELGALYSAKHTWKLAFMADEKSNQINKK